MRGTPRSVDEAVARAFRMTGVLLQAEISSAGPLLQYFGGGYEVATFAGGRFQKVGDTTFVFWRADCEGGQAKLRPLGIVRQQYQGELLVLRGATLRAEAHAGFMFDDSAIHVVPALGMPVDEEKLGSIEVPEYGGTRICNVVLVRMRQGGGLLALYEYVPSGESDLVRFLNKERLTISFSSRFQQMIENGARQLSVAT